MSRGRPGAAQVHDCGHLHEVSYLAGERGRAVLTVCGLSRDAADAVFLLEVLGLQAGEAKEQDMTEQYTVTDRREFAGRPFKARTNGGGVCIYLPTDGRLDCVADSKTDRVLSVPAGGLVEYAKAVR